MVTKFCSGFQIDPFADEPDSVRCTNDWEDDFEAVGIAKCCQCGVKLPVDHDAIEFHSRSCLEAPRRGAPRGMFPKPARCVPKDLADTKEWLESPLRMRGSDAETTCYSSGLEESEGVSADADFTSTDEVQPPCASYQEGVDADEDKETGLEDWEDGFDAIGIAKCSHCGNKLPLDDAAIDQHLRECKARAADAAGDPDAEVGKCCRCQQTIALDVEAVIAHSHVCPALNVTRTISSPQRAARRDRSSSLRLGHSSSVNSTVSGGTDEGRASIAEGASELMSRVSKSWRQTFGCNGPVQAPTSSASALS